MRNSLSRTRRRSVHMCSPLGTAYHLRLLPWMPAHHADRAAGVVTVPLTCGSSGRTMITRLDLRGGTRLATCVSLINWTEQGIKNFRDTTERAEDFSKLVENAGGKIHELVWTVGQYDLVCIAEFPDEERGARAALLQIGSTGNIRCNT